MAHVKMMMNLAVVINEALYLDCIPGEFGHQLRLKGTINGEPNSVMYLKGKVWAAKKALVEAQVIGEEDFDEEPTESLNIPLLKKSFVLTHKQVAGKNYGNLVVSFAEPPQKTLQSSKGKNTGPLLPGEEEGYLEAITGEMAPTSRRKVSIVRTETEEAEHLKAKAALALKEKTEEHTHCWHSDFAVNSSMATWPPTKYEICCHCGAKRWNQQVREPIPEGHGEYYPAQMVWPND